MDAAIKGMENAAKFYANDLEALTEEQILTSPGGTARKAIDFTYEVAFLNHQFAARLCGEEPIPSPDGDDWMTAPTELQTKEAIAAYLADGCAKVISAAQAIPEAEIGKMVGTPGRERPAYALVNFAAMHTMYHDAQLNYIQSLSGDDKMHWF